jgi:hypothetical protein
MDCAKLLHDNSSLASSLISTCLADGEGAADAPEETVRLKGEFLQKLVSQMPSIISEGSYRRDSFLEDVLGAVSASVRAQERDVERRLICLGPRNAGPNVLMMAHHAHIRVLDSSAVFSEEEWSTEDGSHMRTLSVPTDWQAQNLAESLQMDALEETKEGPNSDAALFSRLWTRLRNSVETGFQLSTAAGPIMEEQMYAVLFLVKRIDVVRAAVLDLLTGNSAPAEAGTVSVASLTGQLISECKSACRLAFLSCPVGLTEALYQCELQCDQNHIGKLYGVLQKRRGRVISEDIIEGTQVSPYGRLRIPADMLRLFSYVYCRHCCL